MNILLKNHVFHLVQELYNYLILNLLILVLCIVLIVDLHILSFYIIEIEDKNSNQYQFQWVVQKVEKNEKFKNCWMTVNVSMPIFLNKAA